MENLKLTRIDFRLIHGQVMTRWCKEYETDAIVVVDDRSASSSLLKKILLSAAEKWKADELPKSNSVMILFKNTDTALRAWKAGVKFPSLQVGGIEGAGNKKNIYKNVVMSEEEAAQLKELGDGGVDVYFQPIPEDAHYPLSEALKKF